MFLIIGRLDAMIVLNKPTQHLQRLVALNLKTNCLGYRCKHATLYLRIHIIFSEEDSAVALTKTAEETKKYAQSMQVITDQRVLNEMSAQLEAKR